MIVSMRYSNTILHCFGLILSLAAALLPVRTTNAADALRTVQTGAVGNNQFLNDSVRPAAAQPLHLSFALTHGSETSISTFVDSLTDPSSPNYHKWIAPTEFGARFGANDRDINTVKAYLAAKGFSNIRVWPDKCFISAQTTRSGAESAFSLTIHGYNRLASDVRRGFSATYYAPDRNPQLNSKIANIVSGVFGLSNAVQRVPKWVKAPEAGSQSQATGLTPSELGQVYDISSLHNNGLTGQGETIAIFSPTAFQQSDVNEFLSLNNISAPNINIIDVNGGNSSLSDQDEACIDIETIAGQAPSATINVYEGPNDGSFDIFNRIETDDPDVLSESYGEAESNVSASYAANYETIREAMAAEGITILVASGDEGAYSSTRPLSVGCSVDATSAYVTAIGGTELDALNNGAWNGEIAWTYNDRTLGADTGSGGGLSIYYDEPIWQTGAGVSNSSSNGMRQIPDVAGVASTPYYDIYADGRAEDFGGTSCPTPLWAATMALFDESLGTRQGNIDPTLYAVAASDSSVYHDITSGNNGVYFCTPGWDFVTGWGSTDFGALLSAFQSFRLAPAPTPIIAPNGGAFAGATSAGISDTATNATIYYTTDSTTPTTSSTQYSTGLTISSSETVKAIAVASGYANSLPASAVFTIANTAPTPVISPSGGAFTSAQTVTISDSASNAAIYYSTNGAAPSTSSIPYSGSITISSSETITAIAAVNGLTNSPSASAFFNISPSVPAPVISPDGGSFQSSQTVTIGDALTTAMIYYTTDGTTPTTASAVYKGQIIVSSSETVKAFAASSGYANSAASSAIFTVVSIVPTPTISPNGGIFSIAQTVSISDALGGATIYYTTDGTAPTTSSAVYSSLITVASSATINAIAVVAGYTNSSPASASFTISPVVATFPAGLQMISLPYSYMGVDLDSLFGYSGVKLAVWQPLTVSYALTPTSPADQIEAGQGYWVRFPTTITVAQTGITTAANRPFSITLHPGWNMIGDPFTTAVPVSSLTFNGGTETFIQASSAPNQLIGGTVWAYNQASDAYYAAPNLEPDQGYWILAVSETTMETTAPS
jgi:hypothetical protein